MRRQSFALVFAAILALLLVLACQSRQFPEVKMERVELEGNWNRAQLVLFGSLTNITQAGVQPIASPSPVMPWIRQVYWCEAEFQADAAVKGKLPPPGKKVLWALIRPDCTMNYPSDPAWVADQIPITRVWFFRAEGEYLRPVADGGLFQVPFRWKWTEAAKEQAPQLFASLLLDEGARGLRPERWESAVLEAAEVARTILPEAELIARLKALARNPDASVRDAICGYLKAEFRQPCT